MTPDDQPERYFDGADPVSSGWDGVTFKEVGIIRLALQDKRSDGGEFMWIGWDKEHGYRVNGNFVTWQFGVIIPTDSDDKVIVKTMMVLSSMALRHKAYINYLNDKPDPEGQTLFNGDTP